MAVRERERPLSALFLAEGEFHPPTLADFFPPAILFEGTPFELNRLMLIRILMAVVVALVFAIAFRAPKIVPRGLQNLGELAIDFVRKNIAIEMLGKKNGDRFLPILATVFFTVLATNITGIIPFLNISSNARIGMPLVLALVAYITYWYVGIKKYGLGKYIKSSIVLPNVPLPIHFLLVPIELFQILLLRPFTLTVRLMANMLSGHIMLVLFFSATQFFLFSAGGVMSVLGLGSLLVGIGFTFFELLVIFLQAYIFALLVAVYIDSSLNADSH